jgi:hypothetical protein
VTQSDQSVGKYPFISSLGFVHLKSISIMSILSTSARYESIYLCSEYVIYHWRWLEYTVIRLTVNELETIICCICTKMAVSENVVYVSNHGVGWQRDSRSRLIRSSAICPLKTNFKIFVEKRTSCSILWMSIVSFQDMCTTARVQLMAVCRISDWPENACIAQPSVALSVL